MTEQNNKTVLKSATWYIVSNFILKGITFLTLPIFARILTHNEFGQFNNYSAWLQILTIIVTLNIQAALISATYEFKEKIDEFTLSIFSLSLISAIIWASILNIFKEFFTSFLNLEIYYINCMILYLIFSPALLIFQLKTRLSFKYKANVIISISTAVLTELVSVCLVLTVANKLQGRILGSIIPTIIVGLGIAIYFIIKGKKIKISYWKYALKICIPYMFHSLSLVMLSSMDKVMITKMCGPEETALYSLASNCGLIILLLVTSLNDAFTPWLGDKLDKNKLEDIRQASQKYIIIFFILAFALMLIIPEILLVMGGKSYITAKFVLAPIALGCIYQFLYKMFVNVEQLKKKTLGMSLASISAAIINYILNLIFIDKFGYIAAAYTTVASYIWLLVIHMVVVKKIGYSRVYNYELIVSFAILAFLLTIIINFSYMSMILRLICVLAYIITLGCLFSKNKLQTDKITKSKESQKWSNNQMDKLIIIGAGGYAKSVVDSLDNDKYELVGFIDEMIEEQTHFGFNIIGNKLEDIEDKEKYVYFIAIGNNSKRRKWYEKITRNNLTLINVIDKTANISNNAIIGNGCFFGKFSVVNSQAIIGNNVIVNTKALIEHGCRVKNHCNLSTNSVINGDVIVGEESFLGSGSVTIGQLSIGSNVTIGAGSVVVKDIEDDVVAVGVPAKVIKKKNTTISKKIFIVAEIGCNHNGDPKLAKKMVDLAKECGVDAVKFQTFNSSLLISKYADKAEYQKKTTRK